MSKNPKKNPNRQNDAAAFTVQVNKQPKQTTVRPTGSSPQRRNRHNRQQPPNYKPPSLNDGIPDFLTASAPGKSTPEPAPQLRREKPIRERPLSNDQAQNRTSRQLLRFHRNKGKLTLYGLFFLFVPPVLAFAYALVTVPTAAAVEVIKWLFIISWLLGAVCLVLGWEQGG